MRDESLRRNDIGLRSVDDSWVGKAGRNKLTGEVEVMYRCPECGHRAFHVSPHAGWFHCWACGIWGRTVEAQEEIRRRWQLSHGTPPAATPAPARRPSPQAAAPAATATATAADAAADAPGVEARLTDYMPLDEADLEEVADLSTAETVTDPLQVEARRYLEAQQIPVRWAARMGWGVARRYVRLKGEEQGRLRPCLVYRNFVEGYCCNLKFRSVSSVRKTVERGGRQERVTVWEKGFDQLSSFTPCAPYNIDCLRPAEGVRVGTLYVTEGEKDCLTLRMLGFVRTVSVAAGAQTDHARSFEAFGEWLAPVGTVVIVGDQDLPGRKMVRQLAAYFDDKRVLAATWDQRRWGKDISEVRQRHGDDAARDLVLGATPVARAGLEDYRAEAVRAEVVEAAQGRYDRGYPTGLGELTDRHFRLYGRGGLVVVTGTPNTGKTDFLNFLMMSLLNRRHSHVCFCSFETPDKCRHAGDLTQIWAGGTSLPDLAAEEVRPYADCVMDHVTHICLRRERPTPEAVLRKAGLVKRLHPELEYLVIDPYLYLSMGTGRNITETDSIKALLTDVQDWAHDHRVWVFIVAHPRKLQKDDGSKELEEVDMYTIAGSANWANVADYVLSLKRIQTRDARGRTTADYTRLSVLKVRDQQLCVPGDVFYNRQPCGRYDERAGEKEAQAGKGAQDLLPYALF